MAAKVVSYNSRNVGLEAAAEWAGGFQLDRGDAAELRAKYNDDLPAMVKARQQLKTMDRLSVDRIEATLSVDNNPEREKLLELVEGMPVYTDPEFTPNGDRYEPGKMTRKSYKDAEAATNKLFGQWVEDGLLLVLPYDAVKHIAGIHISPDLRGDRGAAPKAHPHGTGRGAKEEGGERGMELPQ